jgi:hypothetical protein
MRKPILYGLFIPSIICIVLCTTWLVLISNVLLATGGTYGYTTPDGDIVCGIPVFTQDDWSWPAFRLFGVPLVLIIASWRTIAYCRKK